jgi:hypothetical protein
VILVASKIQNSASSLLVITVNTNSCLGPILIDNLRFTGTMTHR